MPLPFLQAFFMTESTRQGNQKKAQNKPDKSPRISEHSSPAEIPLWMRSAGTVDVQRVIEASRGQRPAMIKDLQRTCGNKAVNRILAAHALPAVNRAGQPAIQRDDEEDAEAEREALQKRKEELESEYGAIKANILESFGINLPGTLAELIASGDPDAVVGQLKKHIKESTVEKEIESTDFSWVINGLVDKGRDGSGDSSALSSMKNALNQILKSDAFFKDKIASVKALENQYGGRFVVQFMGGGGERQNQTASQILAGAFQRSESWFRENREQTVNAEMQKLGASAKEYQRIKRELSG
jgi:hypothetical protein